MDTLFNLNSANSVLEMYIIAPLVIPFLAIALSDLFSHANAVPAEVRSIDRRPKKHSRLQRNAAGVQVIQNKESKERSSNACSSKELSSAEQLLAQL